MTPDLSAAVWRKSSHSGGNNGACVELANLGAVRDSKNLSQILRVDLVRLVAAAKADFLTVWSQELGRES